MRKLTQQGKLIALAIAILVTGLAMTTNPVFAEPPDLIGDEKGVIPGGKGVADVVKDHERMHKLEEFQDLVQEKEVGIVPAIVNADVNRDGIADVRDFAVVGAAIADPANALPGANVNGDGVVDAFDGAIVASAMDLGATYKYVTDAQGKQVVKSITITKGDTTLTYTPEGRLMQITQEIKHEVLEEQGLIKRPRGIEE